MVQPLLQPVEYRLQLLLDATCTRAPYLRGTLRSRRQAAARQSLEAAFAIVERVVGDIDEIVRLVRFPGWQHTSAGEREVKKALRKTLFKYKLHAEEELFEKAYGYIKQYY